MSEKQRKQILHEIEDERCRQIVREGWTPEHDDGHPRGEMAIAAGCYALHAHQQRLLVPRQWPWAESFWKPKGARRDLVRAAALIVAEIERLDRAHPTVPCSGDSNG